MHKLTLKDDTMNESDLKKVYNYPIYPRDSIITTDKGFLSLDDRSMGGTLWTCFYMKDKSVYFDSSGGQSNKVLRDQLPKPISYHKY